MIGVKRSEGFVMLLSVVIIGALGLTLALYLFSTSLLTYQGSASLASGLQARYLADSCAELALTQAAGCSPSTISTSTLGGSCSYTITPNGGARTIQVTAFFDGITRRETLLANFSASSSTSSTVSWQEVAHF